MVLRNDRLVAVAGEASGDLIASVALSKLLTSSAKPLQAGGIGGAQMKSAGVDCWFTTDDLSVRGYIEALSKLHHILAVRYWLKKYIEKWAPAVYFGVDAPDFNLGVERWARSLGIRTVHFISPSIWAWRPERIHAIEKSVDHMLCIFPFEPKCYEKTSVRATYVGHPLADLIPMNPDKAWARQELGLGSESRPVIAVLPGSRASEIRANGPAFLDAARDLAKDCRVIIPSLSARLTRSLQRLPECARAMDAGVKILEHVGDVSGDRPMPISHRVLCACDAAIVASGTATLEAALFKRPMVIGYRVPAITYAIMKRKALVADIGLPNLLAGRRIVPEFIQSELRAESLAREVRRWLSGPQEVARLIEEFMQMHQTLALNASGRVADILSQELTR